MPKLLEQLRTLMRVRHYSIRTEEAYIHWIKQYIFFHQKRHPAEMGAPEVTAFLSHLAVQRRVAASTQNQALAAILFLYRKILKQDLPWLENVERAKRPQRLPVVLTREETANVLSHLKEPNWLMASLLYGAGLRLRECLTLRVKDIDFNYHQIIVREGKGDKDRHTVLPTSLSEPLQRHLGRVKAIHVQDLRKGFGRVHLPFALAKKYPNANREWAWQYVFPSAKLSHDPRSGKLRRHHVDEESLQRAAKRAVQGAGISKPV